MPDELRPPFIMLLQNIDDAAYPDDHEPALWVSENCVGVAFHYNEVRRQQTCQAACKLLAIAHGPLTEQ